MELPGGDSNSTASHAEPHCAAHSHFVRDCAVCVRARANFLPYPLRKTTPLPRSFGITGDITESTFRDPTSSRNRYHLGDSADATEASPSLIALRVILRLIWPFSRII